jgi:MraZ protein
MFRGNHPAKVDEKGRLKLPAAFKQLVDAKTITQFYVTSTDGESAQIWPLKDWEEREEKLTSAADDESVEKYLSLTSFYGQQVEMDNQGRVLVPQILRAAAGLDDEDAAVIGMGLYIEVQNRKRCEAKVAATKLTAEDRARLAQLTKRNP